MDKITGLPEEFGVEEILKKEAAKIKVYVEKRKFGKPTTIIEGIDKSNAKELLKKLRSRFACGGTYKDGHIELQGDHRKNMKEALIEEGFKEDQIEII